jgi:hypothetical protein
VVVVVEQLVTGIAELVAAQMVSPAAAAANSTLMPLAVQVLRAF